MLYSSINIDFTYKNIVFLSLNIDFDLANSGEPDKMLHNYAAFHLDLHCLPKYLFRGFRYTKA